MNKHYKTFYSSIIKIMEAKDTTVDVVEVDKNEENTTEQIQTDTEQQTVS